MIGGFGISPYSAMPYGASGAETRVWAVKPFIGALLKRSDPIEFNITNDAWDVDVILVSLAFTASGRELVFENDRFTERYRRGSIRIPINNGHHYILRRTGGWEGTALGIDVRATDLAGSVVSGQSP